MCSLKCVMRFISILSLASMLIFGGGGSSWSACEHTP